MLRPDEKMIYEIPIYSMLPKEFERRWNKWKNGWYEQYRDGAFSREC